MHSQSPPFNDELVEDSWSLFFDVLPILTPLPPLFEEVGNASQKTNKRGDENSKLPKFLENLKSSVSSLSFWLNT
jgi:hypothetical protein